ncbi:MAG: bifunctional riboflavin kinase/FAD synthetase [Clostridiales bacterium]|nr:bifunctional riboflavin kinase/FAD synthetase [Clostridiales bacterium]
MKVYNSLDNIKITDKLVVALGTFDGIHMGHRTIINDAVNVARQKGIKSGVYTFSNHPVNFIKGQEPSDEDAVHLLCSEEDKLKLLEELGVDYVFNVPFDKHIMTMQPMDFIQDILLIKLNVDTVCCGFNYTFGDRAAGNVEMLKSDGVRIGLSVNVHEPVLFDQEVVSSTAIRRLIREGKMETTARYLWRYFHIRGVVKHGNKLGRNLGFPTMNFNAPDYLELPPNGVYFSRIQIDGVKYNSITNIGIKPTVGGHDKTVETFVFDFEKDTYGEEVTVELIKFHRPEKAFNSVEELKKQVLRDCNDAKIFHKKIKEQKYN